MTTSIRTLVVLAAAIALTPTLLADDAPPPLPSFKPRTPSLPDPPLPDSDAKPVTDPATHLPPFNGFGKGGKPLQPGSFPQPGLSGDKVWTVSARETPGAATTPSRVAPAAVERTPKEFGNGWKNFVNQKVMGREAPAAVLAAPRAMGGPRPEWSWHGYDKIQNRPAASEVAANNPDMAPYMKYAHLWKPAAIGGAFTQPVAAPATMPPAVTEPVAPAITPSVTTPLAEPGRPTPIIIPSDYRPDPRTAKVITLPQPAETTSAGPSLSLREKVSAVCAGRCKNLVVESQGADRVRVAFAVRDQIDADTLIGQLGQLPELAAYRVDFEVQIGQ